MATDIEISGYSIWADLQKIRSTNPLIHNITNSVVQDFTANALLALGASPIMSDSLDETEELVAASNALNINIGTPNPQSIETMLKAIRTAQELGKPVALDPVAVGATKLRRTLIENLLRSGRPTIVRGNLAEISVFAGMQWGGKGVDSGADLQNSGEIVRKAARKIGCGIVGTGKTDYASDGERLFSIANGDPLMTRVTGMGCVATSIVAAFLAVQRIPLVAAATRCTSFGPRLACCIAPRKTLLDGIGSRCGCFGRGCRANVTGCAARPTLKAGVRAVPSVPVQPTLQCRKNKDLSFRTSQENRADPDGVRA